MKKILLLTGMQAVLVSLGCYAEKMTVKNELDIAIYCYLEEDGMGGCDFHFDTNFPGLPRGSIPPQTTVENDFGWQCDRAYYKSITVQVVGNGKRTPLMLNIPYVKYSIAHLRYYNILVWREGDTVYLGFGTSWDAIKSSSVKAFMPWEAFKKSDHATLERLLTTVIQRLG